MKNYEELPKCELHIHIEGSLEPQMLLDLALRNNITLPYKNIADVISAYQFTNLQSFLDIYYQGAGVLIKEQDFYDLMYAYLSKSHHENIVHCEIFFDPQTHTARGIDFAVFMNGFTRAIADAKKHYGISAMLILCFLRHLSEESGFETWEMARPYRDKLVGVGLDSSERGNPPEKFQRLFAQCRRDGMRIVAHAGEEGPASYITTALELLGAERIDHGVQAITDKSVMNILRDKKIPLTVCPLSNQKLCVYPNLGDHSLGALHQHGLIITINSDDPAYFGGYLTQNFHAIDSALGLDPATHHAFVRNGFLASFLSDSQKNEWLKIIG